MPKPPKPPKSPEPPKSPPRKDGKPIPNEQKKGQPKRPPYKGR